METNKTSDDSYTQSELNTYSKSKRLNDVDTVTTTESSKFSLQEYRKHQEEDGCHKDNQIIKYFAGGIPEEKMTVDFKAMAYCNIPEIDIPRELEIPASSPADITCFSDDDMIPSDVLLCSKEDPITKDNSNHTSGINKLIFEVEEILAESKSAISIPPLSRTKHFYRMVTPQSSNVSPKRLRNIPQTDKIESQKKLKRKKKGKKKSKKSERNQKSTVPDGNKDHHGENNFPIKNLSTVQELSIRSGLNVE